MHHLCDLKIGASDFARFMCLTVQIDDAIRCGNLSASALSFFCAGSASSEMVGGGDEAVCIGVFYGSSFPARNPTKQTPGAGRRVNVESRAAGANNIDATTGDIKSDSDSRGH